MTERRAYPSDLSDARWALIKPRLTAWRQTRTDARTRLHIEGRTLTHDLREIFNAILYVNRTGIAWRYLPHDFPAHATVYGYFALWSKEGMSSPRFDGAEAPPNRGNSEQPLPDHPEYGSADNGPPHRYQILRSAKPRRLSARVCRLGLPGRPP
ncbi:hypothetical protein Ahu01nite_100380 [Winogradskya humida]|uniref:Insertion element IS402-like domain-containing protein n=1 Tax=Winogradskya humida TaxID=113566 RepID=A0ABQ4A7V2_9ACTN|nr:hypothetical protein Ahu01nite_100380 [Actinoplanes humidus]